MYFKTRARGAIAFPCSISRGGLHELPHSHDPPIPQDTLLSVSLIPKPLTIKTIVTQSGLSVESTMNDWLIFFNSYPYVSF